MKLFTHAILFTASVAVLSAASPDANVGGGLEKRQGFLDDIKKGMSEIFHPHAGPTSATTGKDDGGDDQKTTAPSVPPSPTAKPPTPTKSQTDVKTQTSDKTNDKPTSKTSAKATQTGKTDTDDDDTQDDKPTSPPPAPTPTGAPCKNKNEKRCVNGGAYQECDGKVWVDRSCDKSNVCGKNTKGEVACVSPNQATVSLEACSKKDEQRCANTGNPSQYQQCDGKFWQNLSCGTNLKCSPSATPGKVGCGDGTSLTYAFTLHSNTAYVPPNAASTTAMSTVVYTFAAAFAIALVAGF
ncbi:hypothetical protein GGI12_000331 [Dipsacomyces acuminosporus]|nr:hypothetical protein GGI12_000331 [Dipsacomyces acuminosporus]